MNYVAGSSTAPFKIAEALPQSVQQTPKKTFWEHKPKRVFSRLGYDLSALLPVLLEKDLVVLKGPKPDPSPLPEGFKMNEYCEFHMAKGHTTDNCITLRHAIQDLLEKGKITIPG